MADITLKFNNITINNSLQVGDKAYYSNIGASPNSDIEYGIASDTPIYIGTVKSISSNNIVVTTDNNTGTLPTGTSGEFAMFQKSSEVNVSSLSGYYASVTLSNNSEEKAELFTLSSEVSISSK
jgi:hypothetical protein